MPDVICLGELLVDMTAQEFEVRLEQAFTFEKNAGGAPANVAVGCASLGADTGLITKIGDDSFGRFLRTTVQEAGVDVQGVIVTDDNATQLAFVAIGKGGVPDFEFHVKQPAHDQLTAEDLNVDFITEALVFHFGPLTLIHEPARTTTFAAVEMAAEAGALISFDANYRKTLWPDEETACDLISEAASLSDLVKVSREELHLITGTADPYDGLHALLEMCPELVSVTLGPDGCAFAGGAYYNEVDGIQIPELVDTTGCGDAFVAASIAWLLDSDTDIADLTAEQKLQMYRYANAAGAFASMTAGAIASMPDPDDMRRMIKHAYG